MHAIGGLPLQPAELLALPLVVLAAWRLLRHTPRIVWTNVDTGVLAWLVAVVAGAGWFLLRAGAADASVVGDLAVTLYLALLYFAIRVLAGEGSVEAAPDAMVVGAAIASLLGAIGVAMSGFGIDTPLTLTAEYPYIGSVARARALTATPNMLASIQMLALLLLAARAAPLRGPGTRRLAAGVLATGLAFTYSKTVVPLAVGLAVVWALSLRATSRGVRAGLAASWLAAAAIFALLSHYVLVCDAAQRGPLERAMSIAGEPGLRLDFMRRQCDVYPTNYAFNKRASLIAIARSWPWGIGPGRHPAFTQVLEREGLYPKTLWPGSPHSSYTGAAAELGLVGLVGLVAFLAGLTMGVRDTLRVEATRPLGVAAAAVLAALLIEAIATDVMHFRHYTWLAALVGSASARSRS